ncbi:hypothetical protein [Clostridium tyrobutyricum]|uniref:hypothetical protein n=1 Tax=Clostridium tyrobutyricum TaxID=1519 RepID=UPI001C38B5F2|nr:hypothetical protein [Clostridium tyrobutyricum]MBV4417162.1 hypothetical protein [Clostridium tyrobutyricum]
MNKKLKNLVATIVIATSLTIGAGAIKVQAASNPIPQTTKLWCIKTNVTKDKIWTIKFNKPVDVNSLVNGVHVYDSNYNELPLTIYVADDKRSIQIQTDYKNGATYNLFIANVTSNGEALKPVWMLFKVKEAI